MRTLGDKKMKRSDERGNVMLVALLGLLIMLLVGAIAVDTGIMYFRRQDLRSIAEASALAGAQSVLRSPADARLAALNIALMNGYRGNISVGGFVDPVRLKDKVGSEVTLKAAVAGDLLTENEVIELLYQSLMNPLEDQFLNEKHNELSDNFAAIPIAKFSPNQINDLFYQTTNLDEPLKTGKAGLVALLSNSPDTAVWKNFKNIEELTAYPDPNRAPNLTIVTPMIDRDLLKKNVASKTAVGIFIDEKMVTHFAKFVGSDYLKDAGAYSVAANGIVEGLETNWELGTGGGLTASPILYNDHLYAVESTGTTKGRIICVDAKTGVPAWTFSLHTGERRMFDASKKPFSIKRLSMEWWEENATQSNFPQSYNDFIFNSITALYEHGVSSTPTFARGNVYVQAKDGFLYCLDASTGIPKWKYNFGYVENANPMNATPFAPDRSFPVYPATKRVLEGYTVTGKVPSPVVYGDYLFLPSSSSSNYVSDGSCLFQQHLNSIIAIPLNTTGIVQNNEVIESAVSICSLGALNGDDDLKRYNNGMNAARWHNQKWDQTPVAERGTIASTPVITDIHPSWLKSNKGIIPDAYDSEGNAYDAVMVVGSLDGYMYCVGIDFNKKNSNKPAYGLIWLHDTGKAVAGDLHFYDGAVYVGNHDGDMMKYLMNPRTADGSSGIGKEIARDGVTAQTYNMWNGNFWTAEDPNVPENKPRWIINPDKKPYRTINPSNNAVTILNPAANYAAGTGTNVGSSLVSYLNGKKSVIYGDNFGYVYNLFDPDPVSLGEKPEPGVSYAPSSVWEKHPSKWIGSTSFTPTFCYLNGEPTFFMGGSGAGKEFFNIGEYGVKDNIGLVFSMNADTGTINDARNYYLRDAISSSPIVDDNTLYITGVDNSIRSFSWSGKATKTEASLVR